VLRLLELAGKIERMLDGGRLDTERYLWRRTAGKLPAPARDREARLAGKRAASNKAASKPAANGKAAAMRSASARAARPRA
jgi:hypothetical protein